MYLHELTPAPGSHKKKRRVGRGPGSGRGKTAGRGTKGQKARSGGGVPPYFEGGQNPLVKRMPHKRGFVNPSRKEYAIANLQDLNRFDAGEEVGLESLVAAGIVRNARRPVKILGDGELDRSLKVWAHKFSASAKEKIKAAGGEAHELGAEDSKAGMREE